MLEFVHAAASVGIAILLLATLRAFSEVTVLAYAASRVVESVLIMVSALAALLLLPLSKRYAQVVGSNASQLQDLALVLTKSYDFSFRGDDHTGCRQRRPLLCLVPREPCAKGARASGHGRIRLRVCQRLVSHFR